MAPSFKAPQIPGSKPKPRIVVSEEKRKEAMSGMGGEKTKLGEDSTAAEPLSAPAPAPVPPVPAVAAEMISPPAPAPPVDEYPAPSPVESSPPPLARTRPAPAAPATTPRRGRPPRQVEESSLPELDRSIRIGLTVWKEIRKNLVNLPEGPGLPTNIKQYIAQAHHAYEAQLRKEGKLPG